MNFILFTVLALAADKEVILQIPPFWDDERKVKIERKSISVNQENNVQTCEFSGGKVSVISQQGNEVKFRTKNKSGCANIVMSKDEFDNLKPENVRKRIGELDEKQKQFEAQLDADLEKVLKSRGDSCLPKGQGLEMGKVYKLNGSIYRYHEGTAVRNLGGGFCQAESESLMEMVGFDRTGKFAVAVFRRGKDSKGVVPEGSDNKQAKVCENDARVVVPVEKLKNYFSFGEANAAESLSVKGVMAMFKKSPKTCDPGEIGSEAFVSSSKRGKSGSQQNQQDVQGGVSGSSDGQPADGTGAQ